MKNWLFMALVVMFMGLMAFQERQEKEAILKLTRGELETIYGIIDDAAVPGQVRKPLLQKLEVAYQAAFQQPAPVKDTSKPKNN